jgi:aspartyl-tRNA(Asn)/glutamyl-tRNA(Gln) amidotransferase subunit C
MPRPLPLADVDRMAALARLALNDDERERFAAQLASILEFASQVIASDASDAIEAEGAGSAAAAGRDRLRDDRARPSLDRDRLLAPAPDADIDRGLFKVPRVLGS